MPEYFNENLLMDDYPLVVLPKLAQAVGLENAIVVQRLYWLFKRPENGKLIDGHRWIFNTYEQWQKDHFPFWSAVTIKRIFLKLEKMGILLSRQPEGRISRRKYYRLNQGAVNLMRSGKLQIPERINLIPSNVSKRSVPITENTSENTWSKETEDSAESAGELMVSNVKQNGVKRNIIPSREEVEDFIASADLSEIANKRGAIYDDLAARSWTHFNSRLQRYEPIRDWRAYLQALDDHIGGATEGRAR